MTSIDPVIFIPEHLLEAYREAYRERTHSMLSVVTCVRASLPKWHSISKVYNALRASIRPEDRVAACEGWIKAGHGIPEASCAACPVEACSLVEVPRA